MNAKKDSNRRFIVHGNSLSYSNPVKADSQKRHFSLILGFFHRFFHRFGGEMPTIARIALPVLQCYH